MERRQVTPRPDWRRRVEEVGLVYHTIDEQDSCWDESVAYELSAAEIDTIETATEELHARCLEAVEHVAGSREVMDRLLIPRPFQDYLVRSWRRRDPHLYGRFDLAFDPGNPRLQEPNLLEYNADTPTLLLETAVVQWHWLEDTRADADQFNSAHEKLIERWQEIGALMPPGAMLHLSAIDDAAEDYMTVQYLADTAQQAGLRHKYVPIPDVGWRTATREFVDRENEPISFWFKLYPWEWLAAEQFGPHLLDDRVGVVEPVWKMALSNKAILAVLWELFPDHPNLLPAYWDRAKLGDSWIAKPILAREGANIELKRPGSAAIATGGSYRDLPLVYQESVDLFSRDGHYAVLGSWMIGDKAAGMCVREDTQPILRNTSRTVPHWFR
jgi:glutathionylspermidine synthase